MKYLTVLIVMSVGGWTNAESEISVKFQTCDAEANWKVADANCSINIRDGESKITTYISVRNNISAVRSQIKVSLLLPVAGQVTMLDHTEKDLCERFRNSSMSTMALMALNEFPDIGHFPEGCPIQMGVYYIKDLFFPSTFLPSYLPPGHFQFELKMYGTTENTEVLLFYNLNIRGIIESVKEDFTSNKRMDNPLFNLFPK